MIRPALRERGGLPARAGKGVPILVVPVLVRRLLAAAIAALVLVVPVVYYRASYTHSKRLREIAPGVIYRSGQLTASGFTEAVRRQGIRTFINLQDEYPDPDLPWHYFGGGTIAESELCRRLNVRYVWMPPDIISRRKVPAERPAAIDRFLGILDDPANHPVLIHCRAGLHRTGVMAAVYRMEYEGYSPAEALRDARANGFGDFACTSANDYIVQYILTYRRGLRRASPEAVTHAANPPP
jgi:tyrosine-protein phosphatase SIW14